MVFNGAQFHLLLNHLPVVGFVGATIALIGAIALKSVEVKRFVLGIIIITGLSALPALWTGELAEEVVEHVPGIDKVLIDQHEEAAQVATVLALVCAAAAAGALLLQLRKPESFRKTLPGVFVLCLVAVVVMGIAAHDGGMIRHPEIRSGEVSHTNKAMSNDRGGDD